MHNESLGKVIRLLNIQENGLLIVCHA